MSSVEKDTKVEDETPGDESGDRRKHQKEAQHQAKWQNHKKHYFMLTNSGKPIYTRYGDEYELAGFMGILQAITSHGELNNDLIRFIIAGSVKVCFMTKGPIILVSISRTNEPISILRDQIELMYAQIISIFTLSIENLLTRRNTHDLKQIMGGSERLLDTLASKLQLDLSLGMKGIHPFRVSSTARNFVGATLQTIKSPDILYAMILAKNQIVSLVRNKRQNLHPDDAQVLINLITGSTGFRHSEVWTPVCLPQLSAKAWLHCYVNFIRKDVALVIVSATQENFYFCSQAKDDVLKELESSKSLDTIVAALEDHENYCPTLPGISGLNHFFYKSLVTSQMTMPSFTGPYLGITERKRLLQLYQQMYYRATPHKVFYQQYQNESVLALAKKESFFVCAVLSPFESKTQASAICLQLLQWIRNEDPRLFLPNLTFL